MTDVTLGNGKNFLRTCAYMYAGGISWTDPSHPSFWQTGHLSLENTMFNSTKPYTFQSKTIRFYESYVQTTTGRLRRRQRYDADELVQALPRRTHTNGSAAQCQSAASAHREVHHRKVLHRRLTQRNTRKPKTPCGKAVSLHRRGNSPITKCANRSLKIVLCTSNCKLL